MSVLADWLERQAPAWLDSPCPITPAQRRALLAISRCRTPALGGHLYRCTECDETDFAYHSCHHRACPRCGGRRTAEWTARQTEQLLPVPYFLVTFTVPEQLRPVFLARPALLHDLLFAQAAAALQAVASRPRLLGAVLGMVAVLHTWGRQMQYHPHLHVIVPGGGLRADGTRWVPSRQPDWLLPMQAVSAAFRQGFDDALRAHAPELHAQVAASVWRTKWWVHSQHAGSGAAVVQYLARYVFRTAISDHRILSATDEAVSFSYTDSKTQQPGTCQLPADEFMRRFLQHVLPPGQHRVRYFGWMHPGARARRRVVETLLSTVIVVPPRTEEPPPWHLRCNHCGAFALVRMGRIKPAASGLICHRPTGPPLARCA
jgi:hypothetical protein